MLVYCPMKSNGLSQYCPTFSENFNEEEISKQFKKHKILKTCLYGKLDASHE